MSVVANVAINVDSSKAVQQLKAVDTASKQLDDGLKGAANGAKGFGAALQAALGPLLAVSTAVAVVQKSLTTAFERGNAEQRLKNLTASTGEYEAALGVAASASKKFGLTQTEATTALADVYGRLKGVGFGLKETSEIYDGFNVIAKQSGLAGEEAAGAFFQLSQALGKGKLNGDEFVIVAERMPQLLDAIAKTTGKSRGELQQMASDGKITSQVLYEALSGAAGAAGGLNEKLTEQQKTMAGLRQISDQLLNSIGQVFAPLVIKGAEALIWAGQKMSEWWGYLGNKVFPEVLNAIKPAVDAMKKLWDQIPWDTILNYIQGALIQGINNLIGALKFMSPIVGFIVEKMIALSQNPVFQFIADSVGKVLNFLIPANGEVTKFTAKQAEAEKAAAATVGQYSSMPPKIAEVTKATQATLDAQSKIVDATKEALAALDRQIEFKGQIGNIVSAQLDAEKQLNELQKIGLEQQYKLATTADQRRKIAIDIFNNEVNAAKIVYQQALANIELEKEKAKIAIDQAILKEKQILAEGQLQILQSKSVEEENKKRSALESALSAQNEVVKATVQQSITQDLIAGYAKKTAEAQYKTAVETAGVGLAQKLVSDEIGMSVKQANNLKDRVVEGAVSTEFMGTTAKDLQMKMDGAARAIKAGTDSALQGVQSYSAGAVTAGISTDEWRKKVLEGVGAQQQVAVAVEKTTSQVVASNNIRAKSVVQADKEIVESSGFSAKRVSENWAKVANGFEEYVFKPISKAWNDLLQLLPKAMENAINAVKRALNSIVSGIKETIHNVLQFIANSINRIGSQVNKLISAFNRLKGPQIPYVPTLRISAFAKGGVVTGPTLAMVGEGGEPEYIIPASKMAGAAQNFLNGKRGPSVIPAFADGGYVGSINDTSDPLRNLANIAFNEKLAKLQAVGQMLNVPLRPVAAGISMASLPSTTGMSAQVDVDAGPITINVTTGPTVTFNGEEYVTKKDFKEGLQQVAESVYKGLRKPSTRIALSLN